MHRTGHWLGLDVHDAGDYKRDQAWRTLAPGMALTVEPGLYIRPGADVPSRLHGIGVRIEDDVVVTAGGWGRVPPGGAERGGGGRTRVGGGGRKRPGWAGARGPGRGGGVGRR